MPLKYLFDRDKMAIYPWYISDITATKDIAKICPSPIKEVFFVIRKDFLTGYFEEKSAYRVGEYFFKKILKDRSFFKKVVKEVYFYSARMEAFNEKIKKIKSPEELSDNKLLAFYKEYVSRLKILRVWGWVPVFLDGIDKNFLSEYIQEQLAFQSKGKTKAEIGKIYTVLSSSEKMSEVQKEELAKLNLLIKIKNKIDLKNSKIAGLLNNHLEKFGWLTYGYLGPGMSINCLIKSLEDSLKRGNILKQKNKLEKHYQNIYKEKKKLIKNLSLSSELKYLFAVSSELMYIKDYRKGIYQKSYLVMDKVLEELARRLDLSLKEIKYLVFEEIEQALLKNKKSIYKRKAKLRSQKCCYHVKAGKIKVFEGVLVEKMEKKFIPIKKETKEGIKELRGMTAYSGKVRGRVKIILTVEDVSKLKKGDILVSSSTNPDLIMAMRKAAAFVTDLGGITSHAAIVSRELKKPCIVGTRIGTHVLKDGDFVEVNADEGIIKIHPVK